MRKAILLVALLGVTSFAASSGVAQAAPIRECGNCDYGIERWTYGPVGGAAIVNLTTRRVSCASARRMVTGITRMSSYAMRCRNVTTAWEYADVRCTGRGGRVIRYQTGS